MTAPNATVLIAEDDPVFRRVLGVAISKHGLKIESVGDGRAAYQRIQQGGIDFLVLDHQMPLCSGIELLEQLSARGGGNAASRQRFFARQKASNWTAQS